MNSMGKSRFLYHEIDNILPKAGCYSWYIDWTQIKAQDYEHEESKRTKFIEAIIDVYSPNPLSAHAFRKGHGNTQEFGEKYEGTLDFISIFRGGNIIKITENFDIFIGFLNFVTSLIVPLYIGKSRNLNQRIKRHINFLNDADSQTDPDIETSEREILKNFSQRFNNTLKENRPLGLRDHMLSVQVIYLPEEFISEFEKNLNYIYKPMFGIR